MTDVPQLAVSVVVASNGRPEWLARCLIGVQQLNYPNFEVVVVADRQSLGILKDDQALRHCKVVPFEERNLSAARNAGIAVAGGDVLAFIDDDAVPEPEWLTFHVKALEHTGADASVGYVRGRNGISFQSRAASVDNEAETHSEPAPDQPLCPKVLPGRAIKLVGTNAAIRIDALSSVGGFDPAFRFFLEDADISLRLSNAGHKIAVAPNAEVHHSFAASSRRTSLRMPRSLFEIGASTAIFFRRHPGANLAELRARLRRRERQRLLRHMVGGTCEPRDVARMMHDLEEGWTAGQTESLAPIELSLTTQPFRRIEQITSDHNIVSGRLFQRSALKKKATRLVAEGHRVSVFSFSLTLIRHHLMFTPQGYWLQTGGQFGRSKRQSRLVRWYTFAERLRAETLRIAKQRGLADTTKQAGVDEQSDSAGKRMN